MSFNPAASTFVPAAIIALVAVFSSTDHADKVLSIQCAFRAFRARNTLKYLRALSAYNESINTPEHHDAACKIQRAFKLTISKTRRYYLQISINYWSFPGSKDEGGSIDLDGNIVTIIEEKVLGRFEANQFVPGKYVFGTFHPFAKDILAEGQDEEQEEEDEDQKEMNSQYIGYVMETELLIRSENFSKRLWELVKLLTTMDPDCLFELCERYGFNPCDYASDCGNPKCQCDHPFGTDIVGNLKAYRASKKASSSSESVFSSNESVSSEITTEDERTGASSSLSVSSRKSLLDMLKEEDNKATLAKVERAIKTLPLFADEWIESLADLEAILSDPIAYASFMEKTKGLPDAVIAALGKCKALMASSNPVPVETKSPAPQQGGGGAVVKTKAFNTASQQGGGGAAVKTKSRQGGADKEPKTVCRNWKAKGSCIHGDNCHYAHHILVALPAVTTTQPSEVATTQTSEATPTQPPSVPEKKPKGRR